jgi:hypothetical protein
MEQNYSETTVSLQKNKNNRKRTCYFLGNGKTSKRSYHTAAELAGRLAELRLAYGLLPCKNGQASSHWDIDIPTHIARLSHQLVNLIGNGTGGAGYGLLRPFPMASLTKPLETAVDMVADERKERLLFLDPQCTVWFTDVEGVIRRSVRVSLHRPRGLFVDPDGKIGVYDNAKVVLEDEQVDPANLLGDKARHWTLVQATADREALWLLLSGRQSERRLLAVPRQDRCHIAREIDPLHFMPTKLFRAGKNVLACDRLGYVFRLNLNSPCLEALCRSTPSPVACGCGTATGFLLVSSSKLCLVQNNRDVKVWDMHDVPGIMNFLPQSIGMLSVGRRQESKKNMLFVLDHAQGTKQRFQRFLMLC